MKTVKLKDRFKTHDLNERFAIYRHLWEKAENYQILTDFPLHLDIELSGICNLKCEACFQSGLIETPLGMMDQVIFRRVIDEGIKNGLSAVKLQIRGESFLHPHLFECIDYAKKQGVMDVQITTNGTLLTSENIQKVHNSGLDAIIVSVDAHHDQSIHRRENIRYSAVEKGVQSLLNYRKQNGKTRPWVRLRSSILQTTPVDLEQTKTLLKKKFPEADVIIVGRIHDFRESVDSFPDLHTNYEIQPCSYLMQRLAIFWNGDVTTCCMDYNNRFNLGNVKDHSLRDLWLSKKMTKFRKKHKEKLRKTMPICKHCHACVVTTNPDVLQDSSPRHIADYR